MKLAFVYTLLLCNVPGSISSDSGSESSSNVFATLRPDDKAPPAITDSLEEVKEIVPNTYEICNSPTLDGATLFMATAGLINEDYFPEFFNEPTGDQMCILHEGLTRCWYTYIPETAKTSSDPVPLVVHAHGYTSCAYLEAGFTRWTVMAEKYGFIVIFPQGNMDSSITNNTCFDAGFCCCDFASDDVTDIDDSGFVRQAISNTVDSLSNEVSIDTKRLYFAGESNGCWFNQFMAAQDSDLVAAVCCHAGGLDAAIFGDLEYAFPNYQPTPIQIVHGDADILIPFYDLIYPSYVAWHDVNECKEKTSIVDPSDLYMTYSSSDCDDNVTVKVIKIFGGGHAPFLGINTDEVDDGPNATVVTVDTTQLSWDFCSMYTLESAPTLPEPVPYVSPNTFVDIFDD